MISRLMMGVPPHNDVLGPALSFPKEVGFRKSTTVVGAVKLYLLNSIFCAEWMSTRSVNFSLSLNLRTFCPDASAVKMGGPPTMLRPQVPGVKGAGYANWLISMTIHGELIEPGGAHIVPVGKQSRIPRAVWPLGGNRSRKVVIRAVGKRERQGCAAFPTDVPRSLPAADDVIRPSTPIQEASSLTYREFVGDAVEKPFGAVESGPRLFQRPVLNGSHTAAGVVGIRTVDGFG